MELNRSQGNLLFGVLIAREGPNGVDIGCVYLPALDEMVWAGRDTAVGGMTKSSSFGRRTKRFLVCFTSPVNFAKISRKDEWIA